jgi:hypothetical protein
VPRKWQGEAWGLCPCGGLRPVDDGNVAITPGGAAQPEPRVMKGMPRPMGVAVCREPGWQ